MGTTEMISLRIAIREVEKLKGFTAEKKRANSVALILHLLNGIERTEREVIQVFSELTRNMPSAD